MTATTTLLQRVTRGGEAAFAKDEFDGRVKALKRLLAERGVDLFLTSGAENIFYLCGQQTPGYYTFQCLAVPARGRPFLVLRGLEAFNARANTYLSAIVGYADDANPADAVAEVLIARGWKGKRIAVDRNAWFLTVNLYERLKRKLGRSVDGSGLVERLRRVKSPRELAAMVRAGRINDAGMAAGLAAVRVGASENDVAAALMQASIAAGSEYVGMEPFVSSGPRCGLPHSTWRRRRLRRADVVILESAACYRRYHAALFRSVALGRVPARARRMYAVCREALDAGLAEMKPGNTCATVHRAVQAVIDAHGESAGYRKRTGYSLGISFAPDWGEGNILSLYRGVETTLEPGMVFHMPITLREYARFTVAVSESVVITPAGHKTLSRIPRDLVEG